MPHDLPLSRDAWIEVDLDAIVRNVRFLRSRLAPGCRLMAVVKADAYGHGAVTVARTAAAAGAAWLGVATVAEGQALRRADVTRPILILGHTPADAARAAVEADLTCAAFALGPAQALAAAGQALGRPARVHVKVDTGMGRLGIQPGEAPEFVRRLQEMPGLVVEGIFTHLARADEPAPESTRDQIARFDRVLAALDRAGLRPPIRHAANSAAILAYPEAHYDMARAGIAVYGCRPGGAPAENLRPALRLLARAVLVKPVPEGAPIGYGATHVTRRATEIATLPVGYGDGYPRALGNVAWVSFDGRPAPVVGRVSMDQITVDVGGMGVAEGDVATVMGVEPSADDVAAWAGTISYEALSRLGPRLPRVYLRGGEAVEVREP